MLSHLKKMVWKKVACCIIIGENPYDEDNT